MQQSVFIPDTAVAERFGVSRATVWRWTQNGVFPQPVKFSPGCTRWRVSDLDAWAAQRMEAAG